MTHAELAEKITALADEFGVLAYGIPDSRRATAKGWPDLVLLGRKGIAFRELKIPPDRLTTAQRVTGYRLQALSLDWAVWTPADLASGLVREVIELIA